MMIKRLFIFLVALFTMGQASFDREETIVIPTTLKCDREKVLYSEKMPYVEEVRIVESVLGKPERVKYTIPEHIVYLYISNTEVPVAKGETFSKRTYNTQFFKVGKPKNRMQKWTAKVYVGNPFYKEDNKWYQTETSTITVEEFEGRSFWDWLFGRFAMASDFSTYSLAGDGTLDFQGDGHTWNEVHNAAVASNIYSTATAHVWTYLTVLTDDFSVARMFLPFDTAGLPDEEDIGSATVNIWVTGVYDNRGDDFAIVGPTTQLFTFMLFATDYPKCSGVHTGDSPPLVEGSDRFTVTVDDAWKSISLDATGLGWVNKTGYTLLGIREEHDLDDAGPGQPYVYGFQIRTSEYAGTDYDPYLSIDYEVESERRIITIF